MIGTIDINTSWFYQENKSRTRTINRLLEIKKLGLWEISTAQFGIPGLMSGLYIEMIWNYNDAEWERYIKWIKELKDGNKNL